MSNDHRISELESQINRLNWELVDAQRDANRLAQLYFELCDNASPWMNQIHERKRNAVRYSQTEREAALLRKKRSGEIRLRHADPQRIADREACSLDKIYPAPSANGTVAVHLHLDREELADEFISYFRNIPFDFDLYISCLETAAVQELCNKFSVLDFAQSVTVRKSPNRGRDVAPLYVLFREEMMRYDYILHVHSLENSFAGENQAAWRRGAMEDICGTENRVRKIFGLLQSSASIGLLYPEPVGSVPLYAYTRRQNGHHLSRLSGELGFAADKTVVNYPVGGFFWTRTAALKPVFDRSFVCEDFEEDCGQKDGTLAHALEIAAGLVVQAQNHSLATLDNRENTVWFAFGQKALRSYFGETVASAKNTFSQYDGVSFDIFDTLITRKLYAPDDLFYLMGDIFEKKYHYPVDFIRFRKQAEQLAEQKFGARTDIHNIYAELPAVMQISPEIAEELKNLEIKLELECCIPRQDMLELFQHLQRKQIPIYLVSDMYLPEDVVVAMLNKCGYRGYTRLYLSCELGIRKDSDTMWAFMNYIWRGKRIIHVGDNFHSDMQNALNRKIAIYPVLNPRAMFELSDMYTHFRERNRHDLAFSYVMGTVVNALLFNSPFALENSHKLRKLSLSSAAKSMFGATLLAFVQSIPQYTEEGQQLLFLAREGHFLQRLYRAYFEQSGRSMNPNSYFLASRRAASVAAIRSEEDIRKILSSSFAGSGNSLVSTRLGVELADVQLNSHVRMPEDLDSVMTILKPYIPEILEKAKQEHELYSIYADAAMDAASGQPPVVIDLGYSGTIQYHLASMLNRRVDGFYLFTETEKKPEKIGCGCQSLFSRDGDLFANWFMENSLLLESILQAPHGQVLHFCRDENSDIGVTAVYREEAAPPSEIFTMQNDILAYASEFAKFEERIGVSFNIDPDVAVLSFLALVHSQMLPGSVMSKFTVEDFFCGNGIKYIDPETNRWVNG